MNYKQKLIEIFEKAKLNNSSTLSLSNGVVRNIEIVAKKSFVQKGVFTVLTTLCIYKILHQNQDIRIHQTQLDGGFSGRSIDTKYITPTLKEIGLPSMAESGWLTRSLEQPYPYTLDYNGKISDKEVKVAFLQLLDCVEEKNVSPEEILILLFNIIIDIQKKNIILIKPLDNPEKLTIKNLIELLNRQFSYNYETFGGAKLPVLAFYSIYEIIISEMSRYDNCYLGELGSHTASDRTSKSSGDIEVFKNGKLFEAVEIKLDKAIDTNIVRIAKEKIIKYNPERYYILSYYEIKEAEKDDIYNIIDEVKSTHGCQIVVNGVIPSLKYYLRLVSNLEDFFTLYSSLIEKDTELKAIHKKIFNDLIENTLRSLK